ncbi:MAG TPA: hypothetical protein VKR32_00835 [Puia sp.]|nr:hypothetical protein [Puia sp.]
MKQSRFTGWSFSAALIIFLSSCGGNGNGNASTADSTAANDSAAKAASTIISTPQNMVVVTHKVKNYATWLTAYDAHDSARVASGLHNFVIGRGLQDSNVVMVALRIDDTAKAKAFIKDPGLKKAMEKGGVVGPPMISFITITWQDTAMIDSKLRSIVSMEVKDWSVWLKGFQDSKQERLNNGITDRAVGHDLDDDKKVNVVTVISDSAKAFAYYKSEALKNTRQKGGVIGEPSRFIYWVAKVYR